MLKRSTIIRATMGLTSLAIYQFGWAGDMFQDTKSTDYPSTTPCKSCQEITMNNTVYYGKCFESPSPFTQKCDDPASGFDCEENFGDCGGNLKRYNSEQDCLNGTGAVDFTNWCSNNAGQVLYTYTTVTGGGGGGAPE